MDAVAVVLSAVPGGAVPAKQVVGMDKRGNGLVALADFALAEVADLVDVLHEAWVLLLEFLVGFSKDQESSQVVDASLELIHKLVFEFCLLVEVFPRLCLNVDDSIVESFCLEAKLTQYPNVGQEVANEFCGFRAA